MAMQVGGDGGEESPINDINTTPLVDVMLVLLIIFLITIPVVLHTIPLNLPKVDFESTVTKPENVNLSIISKDGQCQVYWAVEQVSSEQLFTKGKEALEKEIERQGGIGNITIDSLPEVHIRGDVDTPYKCIGGAIFTMQRVGYLRIGFISEPTSTAAPQ